MIEQAVVDADVDQCTLSFRPLPLGTFNRSRVVDASSELPRLSHQHTLRSSAQ